MGELATMNQPHFYDQLSEEIHTHNVRVGWWDDPDECLYQKLQLTSTEISEATEGARKDLMDTHLEHRKMEEVEYADAMIRILDLGGRLHLKYKPQTKYVSSWCNATNSVGKQHLGINLAIISMSKSLQEYEDYSRNFTFSLLELDYSSVICAIEKVAKNRGFDLYTAIHEKRLYNDQRPDHKRENREKENGKKF